MKEIFKSKMMIGVMVFLLGVVYLSSIQTKKLEERKDPAQISMIATHRS